MTTQHDEEAHAADAKQYDYDHEQESAHDVERERERDQSRSDHPPRDEHDRDDYQPPEEQREREHDRDSGAHDYDAHHHPDDHEKREREESDAHHRHGADVDHDGHHGDLHADRPDNIPDSRPSDHDDSHPDSRPPLRAENGRESDMNAPPSRDTPPGGDDGSTVVNLFVRNVAKHVLEGQLVDLFSKYGTVKSAFVVRDPHSKECRGFGFVKMVNEEGAKKVLEAIQNFDFEGRRISVERAKRDQPHQRTPGAYMGIDRRIRDRYVGMKRTRDYDTGGRHPYGPPPPYGDMRGGGGGGGGGYRGRYDDHPGRQRYEQRPWGEQRMPYEGYGGGFDERERVRRRYDADAPRFPPPPRDYNRGPDQRFREREPPVPRESAEEYI